MLAAIYNAFFIHINNRWITKCNELIFYTYLKTWEIISGSNRPFEINLLKARVFLSFLYIFFKRIDVAPERAIYSMFRDQDPALKSKALAKIVLPELYCIRVRNRSEAVIENNLWEFHAVILNPATTEVNPTALHAKNQRKTEE